MDCEIGEVTTSDKHRVSAKCQADTGMDRQKKAAGPNTENDKDEGRDSVSESVVDGTDVKDFTNSRSQKRYYTTDMEIRPMQQ